MSIPPPLDRSYSTSRHTSIEYSLGDPVKGHGRFRLRADWCGLGRGFARDPADRREAPSRAGVDLNTIRAWFGHANLSTNIYAELAVQTKADTIARCDEAESAPTKRWRDRKDLMRIHRTL